MSRIMVVDDDPALRATLAEVLRLSGFDVTDVEDGAAALRGVALDPPDLLLLDIMMPGMSGLQVLRELRSDRANDDMPIIMVTALSGVRDRVAGLEAGADDYLGKPFESSELLARVQAALRQRRLMLELAQARRTAALLNRELIVLSEDLRAQVATDIHDTILQPLVAMRMWLEGTAQDPEVPERVRRRAADMLSEADAGIRCGRGIIKGLRPPEVASGDLPHLISTEVRELTVEAGLDVEVTVPDSLAGLSPEAETMLYRMVREAVVNSLRHADADRLAVSIAADGGRVVAVIADDGQGFDPERIVESPSGHFGLPGMQLRAEAAGGTMAVRSGPDEGTTVRIELPKEAGVS